MPTPCPHCGSQLDDAPDLAGQWVACPRCSGQFQVPPLAVPLPMVVSRPRVAAPKKQGMHPAKIAMMVATIVWPVLCVSLGALAASGAASNYRYAGHGMYLTPTGVELVDAGDVRARQIQAMWSTSIYVATPIYLAVMFALFVFWFVSKEG